MSDYIINFTDLTKDSILVKPYTSNGPETPASEVPLYGTSIAANTSIVLVGKGFPDYGEIMQENLVRVMEHFAYPTPPAFPIEGQMWFKNDTKELFVCTDPANPVPIDRFTPVSLGVSPTDLDMNGFKIINLANATNPQDAVNLQTGDARYVNTAGDSMTGGLTITTGGLTIQSGTVTIQAGAVISINDAPGAGTHATNKTYVDNALSTAISGLTSVYVNAAGDTMTGNLIISSADLEINNGDFTITGTSAITLGNNRIRDVTDPVDPQDAATKAYVDASVGGGGSDGVVYGGSINIDTGVLTLNRTNALPDVLISNIAAFTHNHSTAVITHDTNPLSDGSRIRQILQPTVTWPNSTMNEVMDVVDGELYRLSSRRSRVIIPGLNHTITARTTGASGTWTIGGTDVTAYFRAGYTFVVSGNTGGGNGTYVAAADAVFTLGNTVITVTGTIPGGATADGIIQNRTISTNLDYVAERNEIMVFKNGVKQYASERGEAVADINIFAPLPENSSVNEGDWCGLSNGSTSFNIAVDGGGASAVNITVSQTNYTINAVNTATPGQHSWTISGNFATSITKNREIIVVGNTGLLGVTTKFKVASATNVGPNTEIRLAEDIVGTPDATGTLNIAFTFADLINSINTTINALGTPITKGDVTITSGGAHCLLEDSSIKFYSHISGVGSNIVITDVSTWITIETNLNADPIVFTSTPIAVEYGFREFGEPAALNAIASNVIDFTSPITNLDVLEIIKII